MSSSDEVGESKSFLQIDEEGYLLANDLRLQDMNFGREILESLTVTDSFTVKSIYREKTIFIEAFDEPFVAHQVFLDENKVFINLPYGLEIEVRLDSFCLDEWDRFHGLTISDVPFVFLSKAQAEFFNLLEDFDDDSITLFGQRIEIPTYFEDRPDLDPSKYWSDVYNSEQNPGWNLNQPCAALVEMLPRLKLPKSNVLVLGSGEGHDAAFFAEFGHIVTAVDFSPEANERAQKRYSHLTNIKWVTEDLFNLPREWDQRFDIIFEYTCFCAVNPKRRNEMTKVWKRLLHEQGQLLAVFFTMPKRIGPPFGASEWELRKRLSGIFQFLFWGRWRTSIERRLGKELFILAKKKAL